VHETRSIITLITLITQREARESKAARLEAEGKLLTAEAARMQLQSKLEQHERELNSLRESSASIARTSAGGGGLQVDALKQLSAALKAAEDERDGDRNRLLAAQLDVLNGQRDLHQARSDQRSEVTVCHLIRVI
jgi:hypothetical protein